MMDVKTYTYGRVGDLLLQVDVWMSRDVTYHRPAVFTHFHGGYMCTGKKGLWEPTWMATACARRGWIYATPNYRLIPEATALDIIDDTVQLHGWICNSLSQEVGVQVDTSKIIWAGSSGGGYVAISSASVVPVAAVLVMYPVIDMSSAYYTQDTDISRPILSDLESVVTYMKANRGKYVTGHEPKLLSDGAADPADLRSQLCTTMLVKNLYPDMLTGVDGMAALIAEHGEEGIPKEYRCVFPLSQPFTKFPPIAVLHGKKDESVTVEESRRLVSRLQEANVSHLFVEIANGPHGFDVAMDDLNIDGPLRPEDMATWPTLDEETFNGMKSMFKFVDSTLA